MLPTSTNISVEVASKIPNGADAIAVFLHKQADEKHPEMKRIPEALRKIVLELRDAGLVTGKTNELTIQLLPGKSQQRLLIVGLGNIDVFSAECSREGAAVVAKAARKHKLKRVALIAPPFPDKLPGLPKARPSGPGLPTGADALATGLMLSSFSWDEYRGSATKKKDKPDRIDFALVFESSDLSEARSAVKRAVTICQGQNFARTIASRPGNEINPPALAEVAKQLAKEVGLKIRVLDEKEMKRLGMGGILAVGAGSNRTPPRMIVLEHSPAGAKKATQASRLLVVGKAITFDTGGISIKPADKMGRMVFDKCGAMAVLGLMYAAAKLKLPIPIVGILASAENHISETAYRPGDLLRMYNGVTVEVTNTDAEGRLVLGDALSWGIEKYKPAAVVDLATLTGGCVVALGHIWAGLMSNSDDLAAEISRSAESAGEKVWRLPIGEEVRELLKSDFADIVNSAGRYASPLTGGAFLSYFIPEDRKTPWVHLDIAGVAETEKEMHYYAKGATGWGVRTLVDWVTSRLK
jgi:leucyl aminopeptidase